MAMSKQEKTNYKRQFNEEHYERLTIYLQPELKEQLKKVVKEQGTSQNRFAVECLEEGIQKAMAKRECGSGE